jgi:V/A-type H+-transporting ATPase subunit I
MLVPMAKVRLIGHRGQLDRVLETLHRLKAMEIIDAAQAPGLGIAPLTTDDAHRHELERLRLLRAHLDACLALADGAAPPVAAAAIEPDGTDRLEREVETTRPELERRARELDALEQEQASLPRYVRLLRRLLPLVPELPGFDGFETTALLIERRHGHVLGELHAALAEIAGPRFDIISAPVDADTVGAVILYPRAQALAVRAIFGRTQVTRVRLPERFEGMAFQEAVASMERRLVDVPVAIEQARDAIAELLRAHPDWPAARAAVAARIEQLEAIRRLGTTQRTFVALGWVPRPELARVREAVEKDSVGEAHVEEIDPEPDEAAPVLLANRPPARPFEFLLRLLALPRAGTMDPSALMAFFLPLFFGMMLGDIAYGLLLLGIAAWFSRHFGKRSTTLRDLGRVLQMGAAWTVVWGVVYGELLGDLGHRLFGLTPIWINRETAIGPLLLFAVAVGAVHVTLALLLGAWTSYRAGTRGKFLERLALLVALAGLFLIAGTAAGHLPRGFMTPAIAGVVVGLVVLVALGGVLGPLLGPLKLLGALGNILSYLRIGAIGLASVYLARVANELAVAGSLWVGVVVAALFHALNLVLGAFSPTIQALRLHYVEFFPKFYESGGQPFRPFGASPPEPGREKRPAA